MGKELSKPRAKPTLVTLDNNKQIISSLRWNDGVMAEYVLVHARKDWLTIGDLARICYGQNIANSRDRVRGRLHKLFKFLLKQHQAFLVVEYGSHSEATAVKLLDRQSPLDCQSAADKLKRMLRRRLMTAEQYNLVVSVIGLQVEENTGSSEAQAG
jgi:hypothetical protein